MNIILCTDCGKIMSRYSLKCIRCNRDNLETFKDINSSQLRARLQQLKLGSQPASPIASGFFVLFLAVAISIATFGYSNLTGEHHPVQTAATSAPITH